MTETEKIGFDAARLFKFISFMLMSYDNINRLVFMGKIVTIFESNLRREGNV